MIGIAVLIIGGIIGAVFGVVLLVALKRLPASTIPWLLVALLAAAVSAVLLWKHVITALAIASVCTLGLAVMFDKVPPGRAISNAMGAFILFFIFTWLAQQLAEPLLHGRDSNLSRWISERINSNHTRTGRTAGLGSDIVGFDMTPTIIPTGILIGLIAALTADRNQRRP